MGTRSYRRANPQPKRLPAFDAGGVVKPGRREAITRGGGTSVATFRHPTGRPDLIPEIFSGARGIPADINLYFGRVTHRLTPGFINAVTLHLEARARRAGRAGRESWATKSARARLRAARRRRRAAQAAPERRQVTLVRFEQCIVRGRERQREQQRKRLPQQLVVAGRVEPWVTHDARLPLEATLHGVVHADEVNLDLTRATSRDDALQQIEVAVVRSHDDQPSRGRATR